MSSPAKRGFALCPTPHCLGPMAGLRAARSSAIIVLSTILVRAHWSVRGWLASQWDCLVEREGEELSPDYCCGWVEDANDPHLALPGEGPRSVVSLVVGLDEGVAPGT